MNVNDFVEEIEAYISGPGIEIDELEGTYIAKGLFMNEESATERIEVGGVTTKGYDPLIKIRKIGEFEIGSLIDLNDPSNHPDYEIDKTSGSYLDEDGFSGTVFELDTVGYEKIRTMIYSLGD